MEPYINSRWKSTTFDETVKTSYGGPLMQKQPMEHHSHNQSRSDLDKQKWEDTSPIGRVHLLCETTAYLGTVSNRPSEIRIRDSGSRPSVHGHELARPTINEETADPLVIRASIRSTP